MATITRTITTYTYTTGKFNPLTMTVENMQTHTSLVKLGQRGRRELEKTAGAPILCEPQETEELYEMDLEVFVKYATPVKKATEDGESK